MYAQASEKAAYLKNLSVQESSHFAIPEDNTSSGPAISNEEQDGHIEEEHSQRVIEETENKDGVNPVGSATEEHQEIGRVALRLNMYEKT